ncbi:Glutathione S-transferase [Vibrio rotiferianus]|uniref:glutathione S-transferase family protein n=1 Tax=Vibrio rotiferianus TaxID=190895 RepID=UPI0028945581|nr:Glutathione S-transferase [Vibrio rotiferianus]
MLELYYYPNNASLAPHFLLHHVKADYELVLVDRKLNAQKSEAYLRLNHSGKIPTLVDGEQVIRESAAICIHIAETFPEYDLIPKIGEATRPLFFQWLTFLTNTLQAQLMVRFYPHRNTTDETMIASIVEAQDIQVAETLLVIDRQLANNPYLVGEKLTACDYFLFMLAGWCIPLESEPSKYPNLSSYLIRLSRNTSIQAVYEKEGLDISRFMNSKHS